MAHYFDNHPLIDFDLLKDNKPRTIKNPLVRYKLRDVWKERSAIYYTHTVEEGQSAQFIADRFYGDVTLDWVIYKVNEIIDPLFEWPLDYNPFINFIKSKYGSVASAQGTLHHYEWKYQDKQVLFDGTIVPQKYFEVDAETYAGLPVDQKREVSNYTYEEEKNDDRRIIKVLDSVYLNTFLDQAESIFE